MSQKITPFLWFDKGKAREAAKFYISVFKDGKILSTETHDNTPSGEIEIITIELMGLQFTLMSAGPEFKFNEAVSFIIDCDGQEEVDYYWEKLSAVPESEQCGWLKDKFGLSWQVLPKQLNELMDKDKSGRVMQAMLQMKKIVIADLEKAYGEK
jgi:predicted 3-demethylubiquinone-9 3-methyltransferase (glyoxalase superfamily)